MENILADITTAVKLTAQVRRERKEGSPARLAKVYRVPVVDFGYWGFTPEACLFYFVLLRRAEIKNGQAAFLLYKDVQCLYRRLNAHNNSVVILHPLLKCLTDSDILIQN